MSLTVRQLETATISSWPAISTAMDGMWLARFARGYSRRANSIQCLDPADDADAPARLRRMCDLYTLNSREPIFRVTPLTGPGVVAALHVAGAELGHPTTGISVVSCDSYYLGEGRPLPGWEDVAAARLDEVIARGADAMDMECETVFAVAAACGARAGAVLATHGNRATNEWLEDYEPAQRNMLRVAARAAARLSIS